MTEEEIKRFLPVEDHMVYPLAGSVISKLCRIALAAKGLEEAEMLRTSDFRNMLETLLRTKESLSNSLSSIEHELLRYKNRSEKAEEALAKYREAVGK